MCYFPSELYNAYWTRAKQGYEVKFNCARRLEIIILIYIPPGWNSFSWGTEVKLTWNQAAATRRAKRNEDSPRETRETKARLL